MDSVQFLAEGRAHEALPGARVPISSHPAATPWWVCGQWVVAGGLCFLLLDHAVSGFLKEHRPRGDAADLLNSVEHFGTPFGAILILITVWLTHPELRSRIGRTLWVPIIAGLLANVVKLLVSRTRPNSFQFEHSIGTSFEGVLRFGMGGSRAQGFPSAHTAFAFAFAVMLGALWPAVRRWFLCLGSLVAMQRVSSCAHFPSDVCIGAAIGWIVGSYGTGNGWFSQLFTKAEEWWFTPKLPTPLGVIAPPAFRNNEPSCPTHP